MFKVGDILRGIAPLGEYYITSKDCLVKVTKIYSTSEMEVEVLKSGIEVEGIEERDCYIGDRYGVKQKFFIPCIINKGKQEVKLDV